MQDAGTAQAGERLNLHATAIVVRNSGVLILGRSGAGKSSFALSVIELMRAQGRFAALVADDRVWVARAGGRLIAEVPQPIAGLVEIRGLGPVAIASVAIAPVAIAHEPRTVLDRVVRLVPAEAAPRLAEGGNETVLGIDLPRLDLAEGNSAGAARALLAWLAVPSTLAG